ncbi:MAG: hypothetical protein R2875_15600 [Desulfobacterales bacterium]
MMHKDMAAIAEQIISDPDGSISRDAAMMLAGASGTDAIDLLAAANRIRAAFLPKKIFTCAILNAKSAAAPRTAPLRPVRTPPDRH